MVTIKDVARLAGVSYTTVSHVINGTRAVASETAEKVRRAIAALDYTPNEGARALKRGDTRTIGVIGPSYVDTFFGEVVAGISAVCYDRGFDVFLFYSEGSVERERDAIEALMRRNADGIAMNSIIPDAPLAELLGRFRKPTALFQRRIEGLAADSFCSDDAAGMREAVNHLVGLGHRRIGFIYACTFESHTANVRMGAFRSALWQAGIELDSDLLIDGQYSLESAFEGAKELLSQPNRPTGLICFSDTMAISAFRAAKDLGLEIPRDLSVVGFDDLEIARYSNPRLTTVRQDKQSLGRAIAETLIARCDDTSIAPAVRTFPATLVVRESTGPAPSP